MPAASRRTALPDPEYAGDLYQDVPMKRLIAWGIDVAFVAGITIFLTVFTFFAAIFFLPFLFVVTSFTYRWVTISAQSATFGMRFMAIELRTADGDYLDSATAFLHTLGYTISVFIAPIQVISVAMMGLSARNQGVSDIILGTVALNKQRA